MDLFFIRHAQSENNALWLKTGSSANRTSDPKLTELGHRQAEKLAEFLCSGEPIGGYPYEEKIKGSDLTHLYCSLMVRAVQTGAKVSQALGLTLEAWPDIHEEGGIYLEDKETGELIGLPGSDRAFFAQNFPELKLPDDLPEGGWYNRPFEPLEARVPRARRFLEDLLKRHGGTNDRVAIISHGGFYNRLIDALLGLEKRDGIWFQLYNVGMTWIRFFDGGIDIAYMNRIDYLPQDMIT
ncbi:MAG: histidine phosphatase family protein [Chloroflexi bacterium]|jgi:2,3-bisphosphoglycerate-dependent phosphoglycerate mutase|nr:histidine phosphatase family protein [Chloroflexota bacterium]